MCGCVGVGKESVVWGVVCVGGGSVGWVWGAGFGCSRWVLWGPLRAALMPRSVTGSASFYRDWSRLWLRWFGALGLGAPGGVLGTSVCCSVATPGDRIREIGLGLSGLGCVGFVLWVWVLRGLLWVPVSLTLFRTHETGRQLLFRLSHDTITFLELHLTHGDL